MSDFDPLSFFDNDIDPAAHAAPVVEAPAVAPAAAPAAEPAPASAPAATQTDPAVEEFKGAPAGFVPLAALHEARAKARTLQEAVEAAKNPANRPAEASPQPAVQVPEAGTPEYDQYITAELRQTQLNSNLNLSESRFTVQHGVEETKKLQDWVAKQDVYFFQRVLGSSDPYAEAKKSYDVDQAAVAYGAIPKDQFEAFKQWQTAQAAAVVTPAVQPTQTVVAPSVAAAAKVEALQPAVSSGTIVNAPSAGGPKTGETDAAPGAAFDKTFN